MTFVHVSLDVEKRQFALLMLNIVTVVWGSDFFALNVYGNHTVVDTLRTVCDVQG